MARKDDLLNSFLEHKLINQKYQLDVGELPKTVREALKSEIPIVKAIAIIIDSLESSEAITDNTLRNTITQFLNEAAI